MLICLHLVNRTGCRELLGYNMVSVYINDICCANRVFIRLNLASEMLWLNSGKIS